MRRYLFEEARVSYGVVYAVALTLTQEAAVAMQ